MSTLEQKRMWHKYRSSAYDDFEWNEFLMEWCKVDNSDYPLIREFAHPERRFTGSIDQIMKQIQYYGVHQRDSVYLTIYEFLEMDENSTKRKRPYYPSVILDRIWWETDAVRVFQGEDNINKVLEYWGDTGDMEILSSSNRRMEVDFGLERAYQDIMMLWKITRKYPSTIIYSGGGFHLYNEIINDMIDNNFPKKVRAPMIYGVKMEYRQLIDKLLSGLPTVDPSGFGDVARVTRIPWTMHPKRLTQVIPIMPYEPLHSIITRAKIWQTPRPIVFE